MKKIAPKKAKEDDCCRDGGECICEKEIKLEALEDCCGGGCCRD